MPISDPAKAQIVTRRILTKKVCRQCGAINAPGAVKCRRCHSRNLRPKRKEVAAKKT
jgi:large subunit ribosomal protein L40e